MEFDEGLGVEGPLNDDPKIRLVRLRIRRYLRHRRQW